MLELGLSFAYNFPDGYFVATPNTSFVWPKDSIKKGIDHNAHVVFNKWGGRTTTSASEHNKAIIAIGGSTTACYSLDQKKMWTTLLQEKLKNQYWVGNFGKPGTFSDHHIIQLEEILHYNGIPKVEKVLVMMGMNDISASLTKPSKYLHSSSFERSIYAFRHLPDSTLPWHRKLALAKLYKQVKQNLKQLSRSKSHGEELQECNREREKTKKVTELPDFTAFLAHYEAKAMELIQIAKFNNVEIVFISQAVLWNKELSKADSKLVCSYVQDKNIHYSLGALEKGMKLFNQRLETICIREKVPFIWNNIESNSTHFFDDCHYTEKGAEVVAEEVYRGLKPYLSD